MEEFQDCEFVVSSADTSLNGNLQLIECAGGHGSQSASAEASFHEGMCVNVCVCMHRRLVEDDTHSFPLLKFLISLLCLSSFVSFVGCSFVGCQ